MDIGKAISFITEDDEWVGKILLGGVIFLIPFIGTIVVLGYMLTVAINVANGVERPLPRWDLFGDMLIRGLHHLLISLVYLLPYIIGSIALACVTFSVGIQAQDSKSVSPMLGVTSCIISPILFLLALAGGVLSYIALARYIKFQQLAAAFEFREVFALARQHSGLLLMAIVVGIIAGFVSALGLIACGIGILFTMMAAYCIQGHALGQITRIIFPETAVEVTPVVQL